MDCRSFASEVCASAIKNFGVFSERRGNRRVRRKVLVGGNLTVGERHVKDFGS